jgi:hypothetical protein
MIQINKLRERERERERERKVLGTARDDGISERREERNGFRGKGRRVLRFSNSFVSGIGFVALQIG